MLKPTDAWPKEVGKKLEAFHLFRDGKTPREISEQLRKPLSTIKNWSVKFDWPRRRTMWQAELARAAKRGAMSAAEKSARRQVSTAKRLQALCVEDIAKFELIGRHQVLPTMKMKTVADVFESAVKIERLARGEVTERVESTPQMDLTRLSTAELLQLKALQKKART